MTAEKAIRVLIGTARDRIQIPETGEVVGVVTADDRYSSLKEKEKYEVLATGRVQVTVPFGNTKTRAKESARSVLVALMASQLARARRGGTKLPRYDYWMEGGSGTLHWKNPS